MKYINLIIIATLITLTGCLGDLDTVPTDPDLVTSETFFTDAQSYKQVLAKVYAGLATTGQQGPAGKGDLGGIDEGFSNYLRQLWYQQEFTTDEAVVGWNDNTILDFHDLDWTSGDVFINGFYNRVFYQVAVCNEFIRQTSEEALARRDADQTLIDIVNTYRQEVRFMRALSYWHALDAFRNIPFVTEVDEVGSFFPPQISAIDLFNYIETELLDVETKIVPVRANEYARADQGAVWALLAKLYLNAEVYVGQDRYNDCLTYCKKIIGAGYTLEDEFQHLFLADNHLSNEVIFPVAFDGIHTRTWGGTTFIIHAAIGGELSPQAEGVDEGWAGMRTTRQIVEKFGSGGDGTIIDFNLGSSNYTKLYLFDVIDGEIFDNATNQISSPLGDKVFEGYRYFDAGSEILITTLPGTFIGDNLGDNEGDGILDKDGTPIKIDMAGLYHLVVDRNDNSYSLTKSDFNLEGSAIPGGSLPLEYNDVTGLLESSLDFLEGSFIITDGNVTYGDSDGDAILTSDGGNISISSTPGEIFVNLFKPDYTYRLASTSYDRRAIFGSKGQNLEINEITDFRDGYSILKFKNIDRNGVQGSDGTHVDTDFPMFRLADFYLMAAECIKRGASGSMAEATEYFNTVRTRAFRSTLTNITENDLDLQQIIDERARELMWEGHRRTDLIRFNQFTSDDYLWAWKGGVIEGQAVPSFRRIFPIPDSDLNNNPNLKQNEGY